MLSQLLINVKLLSMGRFKAVLSGILSQWTLSF